MAERRKNYTKYNEETRRKVVAAKLKNPQLTYQELAKLYNLYCVEIPRYWLKNFKALGEACFKDRRCKK